MASFPYQGRTIKRSTARSGHRHPVTNSNRLSGPRPIRPDWLSPNPSDRRISPSRSDWHSSRVNWLSEVPHRTARLVPQAHRRCLSEPPKPIKPGRPSVHQRLQQLLSTQPERTKPAPKVAISRQIPHQSRRRSIPLEHIRAITAAQTPRKVLRPSSRLH